MNLRNPLARTIGDLTIAYEPADINGTAGFEYTIYRDSRCICSGWSAGTRRDAEQEAKAAIARLEKRAA